MDVVAVAVHISARLDAVAQLEPEIDAALAVAIHRPQPHLHHRLGDGRGVTVARAVDDLELHDPTCCCCCCGMPWPSSPATLAGTLLGWEDVSRRAISRRRRIERPPRSNSRGRSAIGCVFARWYKAVKLVNQCHRLQPRC